MAEQIELKVLPLLPLKNSVLFPGLVMPLSVGRPQSVASVEAALATEDKEVVIVAQKDNTVETPGVRSRGELEDENRGERREDAGTQS